MAEIIAFIVLIASILGFAFTYKPEPMIIEKPVIIENVTEIPNPKEAE